MPVVIIGSVALVAPRICEPALGRFDKYAIRKVCLPMLEHSQNGKIVSGLFFSTKNRQLHLRQECMTHLVRRNKEHISENEFEQGLPLDCRHWLQARIAREQTCLFVDLGFE